MTTDDWLRKMWLAENVARLKAESEAARLLLTDAERDCLEWAEEIAGNCEEFDRVEVLRGLLDRHSAT